MGCGLKRLKISLENVQCTGKVFVNTLTFLSASVKCLLFITTFMFRLQIPNGKTT